MRTVGPTARAVLGVLGQGTGAMALQFGLISRALEENGIRVEKTALYHILKRLVRSGTIAKVGHFYTLPANLSLPGYATLHERMPRIDIRKRKTTSEKTFTDRQNRAVHRWTDEDVRRGAHDHRRIDFPCPRCDYWPPPMTGNLPCIPKGTLTHLIS